MFDRSYTSQQDEELLEPRASDDFPADAANAPPAPAPYRAELGLLASPHERHREALRYLELTRNAVVQRGLVQGDDVRRFEHFMQLDALMYARASFPALVVCGGFNQWLFFLDDQYDNHAEVASSEERVREIIDRAFEALSSGRLPREPSAFDDFSASVGRRIRARASTRLWHRFLQDTHDYLYRGSRVAIAHWGQLLTPAEYRPLRRLDSSMNAVVDMVELGHDTELSPAEVSDPVIRELRQLACDHVAFLNDLASYHREVVRAGSTFNLLHCIAMESCQGSIPKAVPLLVAELNAIFTRFEALAAGLPGKLARHAAALRCMVAGNHRFSFHGGRYHHPEAHLAELRGVPSDAPRSSPNVAHSGR